MQVKKIYLKFNVSYARFGSVRSRLFRLVAILPSILLSSPRHARIRIHASMTLDPIHSDLDLPSPSFTATILIMLHIQPSQILIRYSSFPYIHFP